jgi:hypothetical protein
VTAELSEIRISSMADYPPARLYLASHKWTDDGYTVAEAVARYMEMHPDANEDDVRAEVEAAAA